MSCGVVLVVDDQPDVAEATRAALAREGCEVHVAARPSEVRERVRTVMPTVIVMDLGMPDLDGWEHIRMIRRESGVKATSRPYIIVMSGHNDARSRQLAFEAGCNQYIVKSEGLDVLVNAVRTVLQSVGTPSEHPGAAILQKVLEGSADPEG